MRKIKSLLYLANARVPSEKAHVYQIFQMCDSFARSGVVVMLVHPKRANVDELSWVTDPAGFYGVECAPDLETVPCLDTVKLVTIDFPALNKRVINFAAFAIQTASFSLAATIKICRPGTNTGPIYSRDWPLLLPLAMARNRPRPMIWEAHDLPQGIMARAALRQLLPRLDGVVSISHGLARELHRWEASGHPPILVAPDGVNPERFIGLMPSVDARRKLGWPTDSQIALYSGHLYEWKGVRTLALAAAHLPSSTCVVIVGGTTADLTQFKVWLQEEGLSQHVLVTGYVPPTEIPTYLSAADVLVLPNSGSSPISHTYTSPLKLFEYMAAERPIIASDLPALREVLEHDKTAWLVNSDSPKELAAGITTLLDDRARACRLAKEAAKEVQNYTWNERASQVLEWMHDLTAAD